MYIDGQLTTIEELATSKNLSEYVDKEDYRTTVQNKIERHYQTDCRLAGPAAEAKSLNSTNLVDSQQPTE